MAFITKKTQWVKHEILTCDHPQVEKIWDFGSLPAVAASNEMYYNVGVILYNGEKRTFQSTKDEPEKAITDAEDFLQSLSKTNQQ